MMMKTKFDDVVKENARETWMSNFCYLKWYKILEVWFLMHLYNFAKIENHKNEKLEKMQKSKIINGHSQKMKKNPSVKK